METKILQLIGIMLLPITAYSQVGINTQTPQATMDIVAKNSTGTSAIIEGLLLPRIDRQKAQSMGSSVTKSTLVYINNATTSTQTGTAVNIDAQGFYYFDGAVWQKLTGTGGNIYNSDGTLTASRNVNLSTNNLGFTGAGNVGIGIAAPTAKLEITSGATNTSGLKLTNLKNSSPSTANAATLGVDNNGNVVIQSQAPISTKFKSFTIDTDANTAVNSVVGIGSLEFQYIGSATACSFPNPISPYTYIRVRTTTGVNNVGIAHDARRTQQNNPNSVLVNSVPLTITPTFTDNTLIPIDCFYDPSLNFSFFSYTDATFYRISMSIADGDNLGFGAKGYIFVEYQK